MDRVVTCENVCFFFLDWWFKSLNIYYFFKLLFELTLKLFFFFEDVDEFFETEKKFLVEYNMK